MSESPFYGVECDYHIVTCEYVVSGDTVHLDVSCDLCSRDWCVAADAADCRRY